MTENRQSLPRRRPAELGTFVASLVAVVTALGFDLSTEVVLGVFVLIGSAPALISYFVDLYREAFHELGT